MVEALFTVILNNILINPIAAKFFYPHYIDHITYKES